MAVRGEKKKATNVTPQVQDRRTRTVKKTTENVKKVGPQKGEGASITRKNGRTETGTFNVAVGKKKKQPLNEPGDPNSMKKKHESHAGGGGNVVSKRIRQRVTENQ